MSLPKDIYELTAARAAQKFLLKESQKSERPKPTSVENGLKVQHVDLNRPDAARRYIDAMAHPDTILHLDATVLWRR